MANEFVTDYFTRRKEREAAQVATGALFGTMSPEEAAEGLQIGSELGVPPGVVTAAPDIFRSRLAQQRATTALSDAPLTSAWLRDPTNGALAKDDLDNLTWFEKGLRNFANVGGTLLDTQFGRGVETGVLAGGKIAEATTTLPASMETLFSNRRLSLYDTVAGLPEGASRMDVARSIGARDTDILTDLGMYFLEAAPEERNRLVAQATANVLENKEVLDWFSGRVAEYNAHMQETQGRVANFTDIGDTKDFADWLAFNTGQALPFLAVTALAGTLTGGTGVVGTGLALGAGDIQASLVEEGVTDRADIALVGAVPYAALELLGPVGRLFRGTSPATLTSVAQGYFRRLGREVPASAIEEFINEAGQAIITDYATAIGTGEPVELTDEKLLEWFNEGMAGAAGGAAVSVLTTAVDRRLEREIDAASGAGGTAERLARIDEMAQASKLRERSPGKFREALEAQGLDSDAVLVPADGLRELFQGPNGEMDPETLRTLGIDPDTFEEKVVAGQDVAVPIAAYAAHVSGTDAAAWFAENGKTNPDEMSIAEAKMFRESMADQFAVAQEEAMRAAEEGRAVAASDQQVYDGMFQQLRDAGRTPDVADREARVWSAFFRTMGERYGADPAQLAARFGVNVRGPEQAGAPPVAAPAGEAAPVVESMPVPPAPAPPTTQEVAITSAGREIPVTFRVIDAASLVTSQMDDGRRNPAFPAELQPRDRSRDTSMEQIRRIAQNLDPRLLGPNPSAADGAPIVSPDGIVESGNGRVLAIRQAYGAFPDRAEAYRRYIEGLGYSTEGMTAPVLVRERAGDMTPDDLRAFTREANERSSMDLSDTERAMADAAALPDDALGLYQGGDVDLAANRDFVRAFLTSAVSQNDQGSFIDAEGRMSQRAVRRVQAALLAKAYGDASLVESVMEVTDGNIKAIGGALMDVAPVWAQMRREAANGTIAPEMDQTAALLEAVNMVRRARDEGRPVAEFVGQTDIFSGSSMSPMGEGFLRLMFRDSETLKRPAGRAKVADAIGFYVEEARKTAPGADLLGETADPAAILNAAKDRQYEDPDAQGRFFAQSAYRLGSGDGEIGGDGGRRGGARAEAADGRGADRGGAEPAPGSPEELRALVASGAEPRAIRNHPLIIEAEAEMLRQPATFTEAEMDGEGRFALLGNRTYVGGDGKRFRGLFELLPELDRISASWAGEVRQERKAVILIGPPAAGKSTIAEKMIAPQMGARILDSDEVKKLIPEYRNGIGAGAVHEESSAIAKEHIAQTVRRGDNILLPKVGDNPAKMENEIRRLQGAGYTVDLVLMDVQPKEAFARMIGRFIGTGRLVPPDIAIAAGEKPPGTYRALREKGVADGYAHIDNNGAYDEDPIIIEARGSLAQSLFGLGDGDARADGEAGRGVRPGEGGMGEQAGGVSLFQSLEDGAVARGAFSDERNGQAVVAQALVNRAGLGPQQVRDVLVGEALGAETDGLGSVPPLAAMFAEMRRASAENAQVLDAIIGLVPVDVVNDLAGSQAAAKVLLHNEAMLEDSPAFNAELPVAGRLGDTAATARLLLREIALAATEVAGVAQGAGREAAERGAAVGAGEGKALGQSFARASIQFPRGGLTSGETIINLYEGNDLSSFLHESGHFFLEAFTSLATDPAAPEGMRTDLATIRKFLGATEGQPYTTEMHETWARGFEAYLMEGKAPSLELADAFARFKAWLVRIYKTVRGLNVEITPEIREVMDRMLATDAEIAAVREAQEMLPLFTSSPPGMTEPDWRTYQRMARRGQEQAEQRLLAKTMEKIRREKEAWYRDEKKAVRAQVTAGINARPEYRAIEAMANQKWLGDETREVPDVQIDRDLLVEQFGEGILADLARTRLGGKRAIYGKTGMPPQEAAEFFGFPTAGAMVEALRAAQKRQDAINAETEARMVELYGDPFADGTLEEEALAAIHNEQQAATSVAEARHLARQLGRPTRTIKARIYQQRARMMIGRMRVREAIRPSQFLAAERKAARKAQDAFAKIARGTGGEQALAEALQAKEQQILNGFLYDEAKKVEEYVRKGREKMRRYRNETVRAKLEGGYIEQIDALLEDYDFRVRSARQVQRAESLRAFVDRMIEEGREAEIAIDDRLIDEASRTHYTRLSVDELRGLFDTIDNLDHLGRFKRKLIDAKQARDFDATVEEVTSAMDANLRDNPPNRVETPGERTRRAGRDFLNLTLNADTLLREMDGREDLGPSWRAFKESLDAGMARLTERRFAMADRLDEIYGAYSAKEKREMSKQRHIPALGGLFSKWDIIAIALNTGNEENFARLTNPDVPGSFTRAQVDAALATLDNRDWRVVQDMWDYIDSFWPEIAEKEKRNTGVVPKKVEAMILVDAPAFVTGGYYPIRYDHRLSTRIAEQESKDLMDRMRAGRFGKAQTKNGHTKERKQNVKLPLRLDLSVAHEHLNNVLYDLEIGEPVNNAHKLLRDNRVADMFRQKGKSADYEALELWLQDVAAGDQVRGGFGQAMLRHLRSGFVISRLALNVSSALIQPTGLAQSAVVVGKKAMVKGTLSYLGRIQGWSEDVLAVSPLMRERQRTFERDIFNVTGDLQTGPVSGWNKFQRDVVIPLSFYLMQKVQFYAVDMPTWVAAYEKEIAKSGNEQKARTYADAMVRRAQGSGLMSDRGMMERGTMGRDIRQSELPRLFTALGSYMFAKGNIAYEKTVGTNWKNPAEVMTWAADMALLFTFEALLYAAVKGFLPDDDEDEALWLARETALSAMATLPFVRDAASALSGFEGGIYASILQTTVGKPATQIGQGEADRALINSLVDAAGVFLHLPSTQARYVINAFLEDDLSLRSDPSPMTAIGLGGEGRTSVLDYLMGD